MEPLNHPIIKKSPTEYQNDVFVSQITALEQKIEQVRGSWQRLEETKGFWKFFTRFKIRCTIRQQTRELGHIVALINKINKDNFNEKNEKNVEKDSKATILQIPQETLEKLERHLQDCNEFLGPDKLKKIFWTKAFRSGKKIMRRENRIPPGFRLVRALGDGNCCLRSVAKHFPQENERNFITQKRADLVEAIRTDLLNEVQDNRKDGNLNVFGIDVDATQEQQKEAVNMYCDRIANNGAWLGQEELSYLGPMLNKQIWIYTPDMPVMLPQKILNAQAEGDPIYLFHNHPYPHYDALFREDN